MLTFLAELVPFVELVPMGEVEAILRYGVDLWACFHGAVTLEVNNHLDWVDDLGALFETAVRAALAATDIPAPSPTLRRRFDRRAAQG